MAIRCARVQLSLEFVCCTGQLHATTWTPSGRVHVDVCVLCLQVAAFQMLTGWPQEDLLDALGGTPAAGGFLFDRLEDVLPGPTKLITVSEPSDVQFDDTFGQAAAAAEAAALIHYPVLDRLVHHRGATRQAQPVAFTLLLPATHAGPARHHQLLSGQAVQAAACPAPLGGAVSCICCRPLPAGGSLAGRVP